MKINQKDNSYYGGDRVQLEEEESFALYLNDCHRRQANLYSLTTQNDASKCLMLNQSNAQMRFIASGQSRIYLLQKVEQILKAGPVAIPGLPKLHIHREMPRELMQNSSLEAKLCKAHGFPLLFLPVDCTPKQFSQYLSTHYPDCSLWYNEALKVRRWILEKWQPLGQLFSSISQFITGVASDSLAAQLVLRRYTWYKDYLDALTTFFAERLQFTPGFADQPIHRQLCELYSERCAELESDSGFLNLVGNRVLASVSVNSSVPVKIDTLTATITDSDARQEFKALLMTRQSAIKFCRSISNPAEFPHSGDSDAGSESVDRDEDVEMDRVKSSADLIDTNEVAATVTDLENRPIDKDMMRNKGITKYRQKRERNPRVHLRHKFKKATIRYTSRLAPVRHQLKPYDGEKTGIRTSRTSAMKFRK